jgi:hypothetical protein
VDASGSETIDDQLAQSLLQYDALMVADVGLGKWVIL